jgi:hypothetical protein
MIEGILHSIARAGQITDLDALDATPAEYVTHETQPIPLDQCVKECQKVSAEFHAAMKRLGVESE